MHVFLQANHILQNVLSLFCCWLLFILGWSFVCRASMHAVKSELRELVEVTTLIYISSCCVQSWSSLADCVVVTLYFYFFGISLIFFYL